jgi:hypothetical protein
MTRLERLRGRAASANSRARTRGRLTPILVFVAISSGIFLAPTIIEDFLYAGSALEHLAIQGTAALTAEEVAATLNLPAGRSLGSIGTQEIREATLAEPWIESIRSLRLPGGTLVVSIIERGAVARWLMHESSEVEMIDRNGERFSGRTDPGGALPLVLGRLEDGNRLPSSAILILDELRRHAILVQDPTALTLRLPIDRKQAVGDVSHAAADEPSGYVLQIGDQGPRALLGKVFLRQRIARLAALLESDESRIQDARLIDLRYADRAVLRNEPASG